MSIDYSKVSKVALIGFELKVDLVAQYNPKEITIEQSAGWETKTKGHFSHVEFTNMQPRSLAMELLFDTYEEGVDVTKKYVDKLRLLTSVMDPDDVERYQRPPLVEVRWYDDAYVPFRGVIESLSTKYTMFMPSGMPVRAICNIKMKEAAADFENAKSTKGPLPLKSRW
jgi:hypothetical protein